MKKGNFEEVATVAAIGIGTGAVGFYAADYLQSMVAPSLPASITPTMYGIGKAALGVGVAALSLLTKEKMLQAAAIGAGVGIGINGALGVGKAFGFVSGPYRRRSVGAARNLPQSNTQITGPGGNYGPGGNRNVQTTITGPIRRIRQTGGARNNGQMVPI
jgi:hypothetical protein